MYYVIRRHHDGQSKSGQYVAAPGTGESSYTKRLEDAQTFRTREDVGRNLCPENESIIPIDSLLRKP